LSRSHDLVDAHPTNSLWEFDAKEQSTLNKTSGLISSGSASSKISSPGVGGVFQDTYRGISIDNITTFIDTDGSKKVKFDVNFEAISCVREDPFIVARNDFSKDTIPKYSLGVESIKLNFQIINNDSPACAGTTFLVESEISALGLSASITTGVIAPFYITYGGLFTYDVSSVSSVYGPGMYSINTTITNTSSGLQTHKTFQFELVSSGSSPL
jgi:hypothetical protein